MIRLEKYHGLGNDFLVFLDLGDRCPLDPGAVRALCDRHRGIGADGVIRVTPGPTRELYNADGSRAEMSGNGIGCLVQAAVLLKLSRLGALKSVTFPDLLDEEEGDHEITAEVGSFTYRYGGRVSTRWNSALTPKIERGQMIDRIVRYYSEENSNVHRGVHYLSDVLAGYLVAARIARPVVALTARSSWCAAVRPTWGAWCGKR